MNIVERKVHTGILGPAHDKVKENWRILTVNKFMQLFKKNHYNRDNKVK
jgi:hypothetical protein